MSVRWLWSWRSSASSAFVWSESSAGGAGTAISVAALRTQGFHCATAAPSEGGAAAPQVVAETSAASTSPAVVTENRYFIPSLHCSREGDPGRGYHPRVCSFLKLTSARGPSAVHPGSEGLDPFLTCTVES